MHYARAPFLVVFLSLASACSKAPSAATLPVWTASDHDRAGAPNADQAAAAPPAPATAQNLGAALWDRQCSSCHGPTGRGDGPMAAALHPPDMSLMAWQKSKTDTELVASIRGGKGAMPRFSLADDALAAVVAQVRSFGQK